MVAKNPLSSPYTGRRHSGSDLRCARQCGEEGVVKIGLLPESQAPATQRSLPSQSWTVRCVQYKAWLHHSVVTPHGLMSYCRLHGSYTT